MVESTVIILLMCPDSGKSTVLFCFNCFNSIYQSHYLNLTLHHFPVEQESTSNQEDRRGSTRAVEHSSFKTSHHQSAQNSLMPKSAPNIEQYLWCSRALSFIHALNVLSTRWLVYLLQAAPCRAERAKSAGAWGWHFALSQKCCQFTLSD